MRILFPKGEQKKLIEKILSKISVAEAAKLCSLSERTIRDWRREKFLMDKDAMIKLCKKTKLPKSKNFQEKDNYWYVYKGAKIGGKMGAIACFKKYGSYGGDPEYRKKKWYEWWEREGKYKSKIIKECQPIRKPHFSEELAEFVGIMLGDGSITKSQVAISLNSNSEADYSEFVKSLIKKLFNVYVGTCYDRKYSALRLIVSRSEFVRFCVEKLGLNRGNKVEQQVDIPKWIKADKSYLTACVRGLMDTEGCVFVHRYRVKNKFYQYKKVAFKNYSYPLIQSLHEFFKEIGLQHPRIAKNNKEVRIESKSDVYKYFQVIGFHNPKNLKRYKN